MIGKFATAIVGASLLAGCAADRDVVTEAPPQPTVTSAPVVGKPARRPTRPRACG